MCLFGCLGIIEAHGSSVVNLAIIRDCEVDKNWKVVNSADWPRRLMVRVVTFRNLSITVKRPAADPFQCGAAAEIVGDSLIITVAQTDQIPFRLNSAQGRNLPSHIR